MISLNILDLDGYNPETSIVVLKIFVGKMPPSRVSKYLEHIKNQLEPIFREKGFECIFFGTRVAEEGDALTIEDFEEAKKTLGFDVEPLIKEAMFKRAMKVVDW